MADRVIFQVFEAHFEWLAFVESRSQRSRNTVLCADDVGAFAFEV
jgi:hypothetical protein